MRRQLDVRWILHELNIIMQEMTKQSNTYPDNPGIYCASSRISQSPVNANVYAAINRKLMLLQKKSISVAILFDWFDAIQETTVNTKIGRARRRAETTERDRLFLTKPEIIKEQLFSDKNSDFGL